LRCSGRFKFTELLLQSGNSAHDAPPIHLELGLTGTSGADPTGLLGEATSSTAKPWKAVAKERELYLRAALFGSRILSEDIQDHCGAIDRGTTKDLFEVALLCRSELLVKDHRVSVDRETDLVELFNLSLPDQRGWVEVIS
jgi:hypothetical protein